MLSPEGGGGKMPLRRTFLNLIFRKFKFLENHSFKSDVVVYPGLKVFNSDNAFIFSCNRIAQVILHSHCTVSFLSYKKLYLIHPDPDHDPDPDLIHTDPGSKV